MTFLRVWDVLPVCHFSDEYYTATSYGDRFSAVLLQLSFAFQHHVRRQTWFSYGDLIVASLLQSTLIREHDGVGHTLCGTYIGDSSSYIPSELFSPAVADMVTPPYTTEDTAALPNQTEFYHHRPYPRSKQSIRSLSRSTLTTEVAANFGSTKWTTMASVDSENLRISFFGSPEIIPCLFDFLIAGVSSLIYLFDIEDLTLLIYLKINCQWLLLLLPQLFLHWHPSWFSRSLANRSQVLRQLLLLRSPMAFLQTSYRLLLCQGLQTLASLRPTDSGASEIFWGSFIDSRETALLSSDKGRNPAAAGCVFVCVWNIWKDVKHYLFVPSGPSVDAGGHGSIHQSVANEANDVWRGCAVWSTAPTCEPFYFTGNGQQLSQEPQTSYSSPFEFQLQNGRPCAPFQGLSRLKLRWKNGDGPGILYPQLGNCIL